ncbi:hypothetical protein AURDEDRAFT_150772 [Auricularia subglabra TFB-10046 SS5]|nr:hypothetical protein AURDEDRAFT_150772 [Auricularia subglabra TFB-10046 SS5]
MNLLAVRATLQVRGRVPDGDSDLPDASLPTEQDVVRKFYSGEPDAAWLTPTDISPASLASVAGAALGTYEVPTIKLEALGSCNAIYLLHYASSRRTVSARIPLRDRRHVVRVEPAIATMSYARHVLRMGDVVPEVFAWDASSDNPLGAPYTLQEFAPADCIEGWQALVTISEANPKLLDDLARWHAALAQPLAQHLCGVGELVFAPGATDPSDVASYVLRPLTLRGRYSWDSELPVGTFHAAKTSLCAVWAQRWSDELESAVTEPLRTFDRADAEELQELGVTPEAFTRAAKAVQALAHRALEVLAQCPSHAQPTLVNLDYALRNVLVDPQTLKVRALIDWDDVYVLPFALSAEFPSDLKEKTRCWASTSNSRAASDWLRDGAFDEFPLSLYGEMSEIEPGTPGAMEAGSRNGLIIETAERDTYLAALRACDTRFDFADPSLARTRRHVLKAHHLLMHGAPVWWGHREWLDTVVTDSTRRDASSRLCSGSK